MAGKCMEGSSFDIPTGTTNSEELLVPVKVMHQAERKYEVREVFDGEESKQRQLQAILNKLTPENVDEVLNQVMEANIDSATTLTALVFDIFDRAISKRALCKTYADLCFHLAGTLHHIAFKRILLNKCQEEFERREKDQEMTDKVVTKSSLLGSIQFVGELYKKGMVTERIMHDCIKTLLGKYDSSSEEDLEALCLLMITIGETIDHPKAKEYMDTYFDFMLKLSRKYSLPSRIRFMLKDVINLRNNNWQHKDDGVLKRYEEVCEGSTSKAHRMSHVKGVQYSTFSHRYRFGKRMQTLNRNVWNYKDEKEAKQRQLKALINKITPQSFQRIIVQIQHVDIDDAETAFMVISHVFHTLHFNTCKTFADLCSVLAVLLLDCNCDRKTTFKKLLINACQMEFEQATDEEAIDKFNENTVESRKRRIEIIRFIGELYKKRLIPEKIVHHCAVNLLSEEDAEAVCVLISAVGKTIDHATSKKLTDLYFDWMLKLSNNENQLYRVRFMLKDMIEMRSNNWQPNWKFDLMRMQEIYPDIMFHARSPNATQCFDLQDGCDIFRSRSPHKSVEKQTGRFSGDQLRLLSIKTIHEYYCMRDAEEVQLSIKDLNSSHFHPEMIMLWIVDSFERKNDIDRDLLSKLLVHLCNSQHGLISQTQLTMGLKSVLSKLEDVVIDSPRAGQYLGQVIAKFIHANVVPTKEMATLLFEGGEVHNSIKLEVLHNILETMKMSNG